MFSTRKLVQSLLVAALATSAMACGATIRPGSAGLKFRSLRQKAFVDRIYDPGYYPLWAWNKMVVYDTTAQTREELIHTLTADNLHVPINVTIAYRPKKAELYALHTNVGPEYYEQMLGPTFITLMRAEFARHNHIDLARMSPEIEDRVEAQLQQLMDKFHIQVDRVSIRHIDYDDMVTQAISRKSAVRQQAEQKVFELEIANRDAEIARTTAKGRADAVRIQADGDAAAAVTRGKAQAEVQQSMTKTLTPQYIQLRAFENPGSSYFFVPTDRQGMPIIINTPARKLQ